MTEIRRHRILVVDDDPFILSLYSRVLARAPVDMETARDGLEAIKKISQENFSLILLDLMMPQMTGFEVVKFLKVTRPEALKSVVIVTALSPEAYREQLELSGIHGLVAKPFDGTVLIDYVSDYIEKLEAKSAG